MNVFDNPFFVIFTLTGLLYFWGGESSLLLAKPFSPMRSTASPVIPAFDPIAGSINYSSYNVSRSSEVRQTAESVDESAKNIFCVMSFNAFGPWYARNLETRTDALASYIESSPCGVLLFQEVWLSSHFENLSVVLERLGFHVGEFSSYTRPYNTGLLTAVSKSLSKAPPRYSGHRFSTNYSGLFDQVRKWSGIGKGVGAADFMIDGRDGESKRVVAFNVHLHHGSKSIRKVQLSEVMEFVKDTLKSQAQGKDDLYTLMDGSLVVIGGDFNISHGSDEYMSRLKPLMSAFDTGSLLKRDAALSLVGKLGNENGASLVQGEFPLCTMCSENPYVLPFVGDKMIDYVFWSGAIELRYAFIPNKHQDVFLSDHHGVTVWLEF